MSMQAEFVNLEMEIEEYHAALSVAKVGCRLAIKNLQSPGHPPNETQIANAVRSLEHVLERISQVAENIEARKL